MNADDDRDDKPAISDDEEAGAGVSGPPLGQKYEQPNEPLDLGHASQRVWLVKVPKFLNERWKDVATQNGPSVELGRVRVFDEKDSSGNPRISVLLPPAADGEGTTNGNGGSGAAERWADLPQEYKLTLTNTASRNLFAFGEKDEDISGGAGSSAQGGSRAGSAKKWDEELDISDDDDEDDDEDEDGQPKRKRRKTTRMLGTVHHECTLTPTLSSASAHASYSQILRARHQSAQQPKRSLKMLDADQATQNRLAAGVGAGGVTGARARAQANSLFIKPRQNAGGPAAGERLVRMPQPELLDLLFGHFDRAPYWSVRALKEHTRQPDAYLRETLQEVATLVRSGPYAGMWTLKPEWKGSDNTKRKTEATPGSSPAQGQDGASSSQQQGGGGGPESPAQSPATRVKTEGS